MIELFRMMFGGALATTATLVRPKPKAPMSGEELAAGLTKFRAVTWDLKGATREAWGPIKPVQVTTPFGGHGYVEGRTEALKVNDRVAVTEADDCMDFSSYCVLVDGVPCLILHRKGTDLRVTIVAEREFLAEVFNTAAMFCNTVQDFERLPEPVRKIMHDIIQKTMEIQAARHKDDAIEKMLTY